MDWFKKHVDTVIILGAFGASVLWMNGKFNEVDCRFHEVDNRFSKLEKEFDKRFNELEKDIDKIKTVLILKHIMPTELAHEE